MSLVVQKFGGSSVADASRIQNAAARVMEARAAGQDVVVVVSAMGDTTDELIDLANKVTEQHPPSRREMDMLLAAGEQISAALLAMALQARGQRSISLLGPQIPIHTDAAHSRARIRSIEPDRIQRHLAEGCVVVVAGFQGVNQADDITTLGRGGSDTTAVALAAALGACMCEIFTDVMGIYTTDPRVVPGARLLGAIAYDEILELASQGAAVMHSRSIEFGKKYRVPIHVRHSMRPQNGTMIIEETPDMENVSVRGAAMKKDLARVSLRKIPDRPGVAAQLFADVAAAGIVVDDIVQTEQEDATASISFTFDKQDLADVMPVVKAVLEKVGGSEPPSYQTGLAKVSVVGVGMRTHTGVAQTMFAALAREQINIQNITTSEIKISCIISASDAEHALRTVHAAFELDQG